MEKFGLTYKALEAILLGGYWLDITIEEQHAKKVRSIKSNFTDEERKEIKTLLLLGTDTEEVQKQFGLCKDYLRQIDMSFLIILFHEGKDMLVNRRSACWAIKRPSNISFSI